MDLTLTGPNLKVILICATLTNNVKRGLKEILIQSVAVYGKKLVWILSDMTKSGAMS